MSLRHFSIYFYLTNILIHIPLLRDPIVTGCVGLIAQVELGTLNECQTFFILRVNMLHVEKYAILLKKAKNCYKLA